MSNVSRIRFKKFVLRIKLLDPGADVRESGPGSDVGKSAQSDNAEKFRHLWHQMQRDYQAPVVPWLPRDTAIVRRLLERRTLDALVALGVNFWRQKARDMGVFDDGDQILLFAYFVKTSG